MNIREQTRRPTTLITNHESQLMTWKARHLTRLIMYLGPCNVFPNTPKNYHYTRDQTYNHHILFSNTHNITQTMHQHNDN